MTPAATMVWLATVAALVGGLAALAAGQWWLTRQFHSNRVFELTRDLIERQRALELALERLESLTTIAAQQSSGSMRDATLAHEPRCRLDPAQDEVPPGPTLISVPDLSQRGSLASAQAAELLSQRFGSIWDQAESGATPGSIARDSGLPIGQVELILGLKRQLGGPPNEEAP